MVTLWGFSSCITFVNKFSKFHLHFEPGTVIWCHLKFLGWHQPQSLPRSDIFGYVIRGINRRAQLLFAATFQNFCQQPFCILKILIFYKFPTHPSVFPYIFRMTSMQIVLEHPKRTSHPQPGFNVSPSRLGCFRASHFSSLSRSSVCVKVRVAPI